MKMKKMISITMALAMVVSLTACGSSGSGESKEPAAVPENAATETQEKTETQKKTEAAAEPGEAFEEKTIPVVRDSLDSTDTAKVRYYDDLPSVPYMSVTDFYNDFYLVNTELDEGMAYERKDNKYTVTNFCGDAAVFDVDADTIEVDNMDRFIKLACDLQSADSGGLDPDYPYAMITHKVDPEKATPITLAMTDYNIDLKGDETGVYAPLPTIADIFASPSGYYVVYAGEKIYVRDHVGLYLDSVMEDDPEYFAAIKADRTEDMAQYTYDELCFNMDLWYGKPGQEFIHDELETKKLDEVITGQYPEIREMLLAKDFETFYAGLIHIFAGLLFDGGHTGMGCNALMDDEFELSTRIFKEVRAKDYGACYNRMAERVGHGALREEARESFYKGDYYVEKGDTAIICFNKFVVDTDAWKDFYAGKGDRPLVVEDYETGGETYDTVGVILSGLERAEKNPKIKNIIIDDSCNGGGNDIAMLAIEYLMTGEGYIRDKDAINGQFNTKEEKFDLNFDGKIDGSDASPYTGYRYGVLTSDGSFSCGNAFPFFMQEHDALILGEKSSGGACGIRLSSAGGIEIQNSAASSCTVTKEGETVDNGCPVDVELTGDGENPYDDFYDLAGLSESMNKFFDQTE